MIAYMYNWYDLKKKKVLKGLLIFLETEFELGGNIRNPSVHCLTVGRVQQPSP